MNAIEALARPEILALKPYVSARNSAAADGILLNANEAPYALLPQVPGELPLNRYPAPQPEPLRLRLSELYGVDPSLLLVTRGSDEGIDLLTRVFCRPGVNAIIECPPCFGMYRVAAGIQGAGVIGVPRERESLAVDFNALLQAIKTSEVARLVFLTSPANPTGDVVERADLERVLDAADDRALVVLDEAYVEFCDTPSAADLVAERPNLVVLRTLSKAWAAAGLRCGAVIAQAEVIALLQRVMAPYPLSAPAIDRALACTTDAAQRRQGRMLEEIAVEKARLLDTLARLGRVRRIWPGEANFVLLQVEDAGGLVAWCADRGVRIRSFDGTPGLDGCVRLSIGSAEQMDALVDALEAWEQAQ